MLYSISALPPNVKLSIKYTIASNNALFTPLVIKGIRDIKKINIVIGPEGGISPKEEEYLNSIGFTSISLGENIMRVETVPMFILSILNYENM